MKNPTSSPHRKRHQPSVSHRCQRSGAFAITRHRAVGGGCRARCCLSSSCRPGCPLDLPAEGRAALAAALDGTLPGGQRPDRGEEAAGAFFTIGENQPGLFDAAGALPWESVVEMHHYVRDVAFGEDASRIRCAHRAMAAVRNTIAGILHLHQVPNIAAQLRACHRDPYRLPLQFLGLITPLAPNGNRAVT